MLNTKMLNTVIILVVVEVGVSFSITAHYTMTLAGQELLRTIKS